MHIHYTPVIINKYIFVSCCMQFVNVISWPQIYDHHLPL